MSNFGSNFAITSSGSGGVQSPSGAREPVAAVLMGTISSIIGLDISAAFAAKVLSVPSALSQPSLLTPALLATAPVRPGI